MFVECSFDDYPFLNEDMILQNTYTGIKDFDTALPSSVDSVMQSNLIEHYTNFKEFKSRESMSFIYVKKEELESQLFLFKKFFDFIATYSSNTSYIPIQLSNTNCMGINLCEKLIREQKVDKVVSHLMLHRPFVNDIEENKCYKYISCSEPNPITKTNSFIKYFTKISKITNNLGINVSGYSLDELSNDKIVETVALSCNNLFLFAYPLEIDNVKRYIKILKAT